MEYTSKNDESIKNGPNENNIFSGRGKNISMEDKEKNGGWSLAIGPFLKFWNAVKLVNS